MNLRRQVKTDRLLLHYNGHGVPRPTRNGELWVFGKHHTHYMPVSVYELRNWLGEPSVFVLDCSGAGALLPHFAENAQSAAEGFVFSPTDDGPSQSTGPSKTPPGKGKAMDDRGADVDMPKSPLPLSHDGGAGPASSYKSSCIVLAACGEDEVLPMNPQYPADIFTSCLTTPIPIALRWFVLQVSHACESLSFLRLEEPKN